MVYLPGLAEDRSGPQPPTRWTSDLGTGRPPMPRSMPPPDLLPEPIADLITRYNEQVDAARTTAKSAQELRAARDRIIVDHRQRTARALVDGATPPRDPIPSYDEKHRKASESAEAHYLATELILGELGEAAPPLAVTEAAKAAATRQALAATVLEAISTARQAIADLGEVHQLESWWRDIEAHPERAPTWGGQSNLANRIDGPLSTAAAIAAEAALPDDAPRHAGQTVLAEARSEPEADDD